MGTKNIRDLLVGPAHPSESYGIADFLAESPEYAVDRADTDALISAMPGDAEHPLQRTARNPVPGVGVMTLARALREGSIQDDGLRRRVAAYVEHWQRLYGQPIYSEGHHVVDDTPPRDKGLLRRHGW